MRRSLLLVVGVVLCVVLVTGCMRTEIGVTVDGDGSGRVQLDAYFPTATLEQQGVTEDMLNQIVDGVSKAASAASAKVDLTTIATASERGVRLTIPFDDYHQVSATMTGRDPNLSMVKAFRTFDVSEVPGGGWTFHAAVDTGGITDTLNALVQQARSSGMQLPAGQLDPASIEVTMAMTLPGEITRTNSTDVDGGRARWTLTGDHAVTELSMRTRPAPLNVASVLVGVAVFLLLLVLVALFFRRRRRRRRGGDGGAGASGQGWQPPPVGAVPAAGAWGAPPPAASPWGPPPSGPPGAPPPGPPAGHVPLGGAPGTPQPPPPPNPWAPPASPT